MKALEGLNEKQQIAVSEIEKPMIIIAGAGSGKTRVITHKIAYMIEQGISPRNILALTFTDKASEEMVSRINELLPSIELPTISTFHSFAKEIIEENVFSAGLNTDFKLIDDTSQLVFFSKNIRNWNLKTVDTIHNISGSSQEIKKIISKFKDELITPEKLDAYIKSFSDMALTEDEQNELDGLNDVRICYEQYEKHKKENNMIDFGDMLFLVHKLFSEKPSILSNYQEKYKYILVDEYQDTNYIQLMILDMLAKANRKITIVGDDDQSIYRFRGTYANNIDDFKKLYPEHIEVVLEENYRCSKSILSVANSLIKNKSKGTIKKLVTSKENDDKVNVNEFRSDQDQYNFITREIRELSKTHRLKDIAILVRRKKDAEPLIDTFNKHGIKYEFVGEVNFFDEPLIKDIIAYLRFLENPIEESASLLRILSREVYWIRKIEIARLGKLAKEKKICLYEALDHLNELDADKNKFLFVKNELIDLLDQKDRSSILELVKKIIYQTGFYSHEISLGNMRNINLIQHFERFVSNFKRLNNGAYVKELLEYIDLASGFEMETLQEDANDVVRILTIHAAKGKEFPVVFIPDLVENRLPTRSREDKYKIPKGLLANNQIDSAAEHINEERRLFYVAITRAMNKLYVTYARRYGDNKRDSKISRFLTEINYLKNPDIDFKRLNVDTLIVEESSSTGKTREKIIKSIIADLRTGDYKSSIPKAVLLEKLENHNIDPVEILDAAKKINYDEMEEISKTQNDDDIVEDSHTFSATQFNTYKKCPRQYQYSSIFRIPGRTRTYLELGLSVHKTVEILTEKIKRGVEITPEDAFVTLKENWIATSYETREEEIQSYSEARDMIKNFIEGQKEFRTTIHSLEIPFLIDIDGRKISGKIDRIDKDGDDYIVIDYKTSKMEESEIELKQNFQLFIYSLACKQIFGKYPKQVGLWYLRPNKKVIIDTGEMDMENLKTEMMSTIGRIRQSDFKPTPGWHCKTCDYANICDSKL